MQLLVTAQGHFRHSTAKTAIAIILHVYQASFSWNWRQIAMSPLKHA
jgi:hypothetical protein